MQTGWNHRIHDSSGKDHFHHRVFQNGDGFVVLLQYPESHQGREENRCWNPQLSWEVFVGHLKSITKFGFEPENRNRMVIIGDGIIDAAGLALSLRKKLGYADLVSVEEVEEES
ncbi:hypothetical protein FEM48_Zijuj01G0246100 [Ziziphus jujuba var. spinosa]|uniref:Uncharacterized protein n=1 Tax=Ziziphus jujuba var. spinosa TaxID=714518 RepID=A0A978W4H9_ZIZJJ|nr:hypothetical protein FEM48_Zijuj01G0246100 [Ziziphus jujuba var. spinosa]